MSSFAAAVPARNPWSQAWSSSPLVRALGWALVCWVVIFYRLSYLPLLDPDEAHYAQITREMLSTGQWLVPTIGGVPIIDKPVLFHWLQALSFWTFGESEFAARLPSALSALALLGITYWAGRRLFSAEVGQRGALMLALMPLTLALSSIAIFDMLFTTCLFGAFAVLMVAALERRVALEVVGTILLSIAVQVKGPVALLLVGAAAGLVWLVPSCRSIVRRVHWALVFSGAAALAMPWFIWMLAHFGRQFIDDYVLYNNLWLFLRPEFRQRFYPFFYFRVFASAFFPWSLLCVGRLIDLFRGRAWRRLDAAGTMLWIWTGLIFAFFTASRFKLDTYIYPLAPAACLLASRAWQDVRERDPAATRATRWSLLAAAILLAIAGALVLVACLYVDLRLPPWGLLVPAAAIAGGIGWTVRLLRRGLVPSRYSLPLMGTLLIVYFGVIAVGLPAYRTARPAPHLGRKIASIVGPHDQVAIYRQERWKASVRFYSRKIVVAAEKPEELAAVWNGPNRVYCVMVERDLKALLARGWHASVVFSEPGVVGTAGSVIRQQIWGQVVVVTNHPVDTRLAAAITKSNDENRE